MPERPQYLRDLDAARRADVQVGRSDAAYGKHTMSRPWQAYNQMQTMQSQANPDLDRLKAVRRDWNRNLKYTPAGMAVSGATTPMEAQDAFVRSTEDFRQANKPAYNRMYPLPGNFMDFAEKGGLWGSILSEIAGKTKKRVKDFVAGDGITSIAAGDTPEDKERYITETFGPHLEDVPYGGPPPYEYEGPWPHEGLPEEPEELPPYMREDAGIFGDIPVTEDLSPRDKFNLRIPPWAIGNRDMTTTDTDLAIDPRPWLQDEIEDKPVAPPDEPLPFDQGPLPFDQGKEDFIREQNEYVSPPPVFPGNVRQDPQDTDAYLRWLTAPRLGSADPQGDFDSFNEYPYADISVEFGGDGEAPPPIIPFDDSDREEGIMRAMRAPYAPRIKRSTFVAPHDEFDPDQFRFDNYDEYYNYLRKKRGLGEFTGDYYQGFTYDPRVDGIPLDYIPSAPDLTDR